MNRLVIDTDPGVDDALAILMALAHPGTEVLAICGVAGNVGLDLVMNNIGAVLDLAGAPPIPVHRGCDRALIGDQRDSGGFHGVNGLGGHLLPASRRPVADGHAAIALRDLVRR